MVEFKKYTSIENSFNRDYMNKVRMEMPADLQYVVQEKVHGANTSFICDGETLQFAKRTAVLPEEENFYDYQLTVANMPKLVGFYTKDILEDFLKEYSDKYNSLEKSEQKTFNKKTWRNGKIVCI